jgi:phosphatidylglycerol lysyltransferase
LSWNGSAATNSLTMEFLLLKYGYLLLFAGVLLEGEAFLLAGSFLANRGYFDLTAVVLVALAANTLGAQFYYLAARTRGRPWFESRFSDSPRYRRILDWMGSYGNWVLLLSRFAFGFRIVIPAACGAFGMSQRRFFVLNVGAGVLWAIPTALLGFYFGNGIATVWYQAHRYMTASLTVAFLILALFLAVRHGRRVISTFQYVGWSDLHGLIPFVMGLMGMVNLASALWPKSEAALTQVQKWLPLEVTQESRTLMLFAGIALLQVTRSLARRKETAWYVAVIVLSISLLLHFTGGQELQHSLVAAFLLAYLIYFRRRFYARSDAASMRKALVIAPLLTFLVFLYAFTGFYATRDQFQWSDRVGPLGESFRAGVLIVAPRAVPLTKYTERFVASIQIAGWVSRVYVLVLLLRPVVLRNRQEAPKQAVRRIFTAYGRYSTAAFAVQPDKHHLLLAKGRGLIAYATKGAVAIACGDPMVSIADFDVAVKEFTDHCVRHGWTPSIYLAAEDRLKAYHALGFASQRAAEEAIVDLQLWEASDVEALGRSGLKVRRYDRKLDRQPFLDEQLEEVTEDWLSTRHIGEMGFTIGHFSLESLGDGPVFLVGSDYRLEAFCAWLPYKNGAAMVLDLLRQRHLAPPHTAELLLAESLRMLHSAGVNEVSLSTIPLRSSEPLVTPVDRDLTAMFSPRWEARYIVYPRGAVLARITRALAAVQFGRFRSRWRSRGA